MSYIDDLIAARDNVALKLKQLSADGKPDYSIGDETYSWAQLFQIYSNQLKELNTTIAATQPYEIRTRRIAW